MKKFIISIALLTVPLLAMANIGVSINIGQPNYYGQIQLDNMPPPALLYPNPIIIQPVPGVGYSPLYLRVPEVQYRNWRFYCGRYHACGRRVYFVTDIWVRRDARWQLVRRHATLAED